MTSSMNLNRWYNILIFNLFIWLCKCVVCNFKFDTHLVWLHNKITRTNFCCLPSISEHYFTMIWKILSKIMLWLLGLFSLFYFFRSFHSRPYLAKISKMAVTEVIAAKLKESFSPTHLVCGVLHKFLGSWV